MTTAGPRRFIQLLITAAILSLGGLRVGADELRMDALDQAAPNVGLGSGKELADFRGQWVLLHFWATWCNSCVAELPALDQSARRWSDRMRSFAVSIDDGDPAVVDAFVARLGVTMPVLHRQDAGGYDRYVSWGVPVTYLINPQGRVVGRFLGPRDWTERKVDADLGRLLQAPGSDVGESSP